MYTNVGPNGLRNKQPIQPWFILGFKKLQNGVILLVESKNLDTRSLEYGFESKIKIKLKWHHF